MRRSPLILAALLLASACATAPDPEVVAQEVSGPTERYGPLIEQQAMEMVAVLGRYGGLAAGKAAMERIGIDCGPVRLPLRRLTETERRAFHEELLRLGIFEKKS